MIILMVIIGNNFDIDQYLLLRFESDMDIGKITWRVNLYIPNTFSLLCFFISLLSGFEADFFVDIFGYHGRNNQWQSPLEIRDDRSNARRRY